MHRPREKDRVANVVIIAHHHTLANRTADFFRLPCGCCEMAGPTGILVCPLPHLGSLPAVGEDRLEFVHGCCLIDNLHPSLQQLRPCKLVTAGREMKVRTRSFHQRERAEGKDAQNTDLFIVSTIHASDTTAAVEKWVARTQRTTPRME